MKTLIINGSPRKNGNTSELLTELKNNYMERLLRFQHIIVELWLALIAGNVGRKKVV